MSQTQTRANIKKLTLAERTPFVVVGAIVGLIIGFLISTPHRYAVWFAVAVYCVAMLTGLVDEWTSYLSGFCPSCSKLLKLGRNQKQGECPHCNAKFSVEQQDKQHWIRLNRA